jgi:hypothetical protein
MLSERDASTLVAINAIGSRTKFSGNSLLANDLLVELLYASGK